MGNKCISMLRFAVLSLATVTVLSGQVAADARFGKEFKRKYVERDTPYAELVGEAKCHLCHKGKKKKDLNPYGAELAKLLDRKADKKNKEKIHEALEKVAEIRIDPEDPDSPTYGELIEQGELPGGEPQSEEEEAR